MPVVIAVSYALFGVSITAARLAIIFFAVIGTVGLYCLARELYGRSVGLTAALILATNPFYVFWSREVMLGLPALSLVILSFYFLYRYVEKDKVWSGIAFAIVAASAPWAKQNALWVYPAFLLYPLVRGKQRKLWRFPAPVMYAIGAIILAPLVCMTLTVGTFNVRQSVGAGDLGGLRSFAPASGHSFGSIVWYFRALYREQLSLPALILAVVGLALSLARRDRRVLLPVLWVGAVYVFAAAVWVKLSHYVLIWVGAWCMLSAAPLAAIGSRRWRSIGAAAVIAALCGYQFAYSWSLQNPTALGYRDAARFVVENRRGDSVLYAVRTTPPAFIFHVRQYAERDRMLVLRDNKVLYDEPWWRRDGAPEPLVHSKDEIESLLDRYGVGYVVWGDLTPEDETDPYERNPAMLWLDELLQSDLFTLVETFDITTKDAGRIVKVDQLQIYRYNKDVHITADDLKMDLPVIGRTIEMKLRPRQ